MITQLRPASDRPSSFWILGSAKIATGPSIAAISCMPPIAITDGDEPARRQPSREVSSRMVQRGRFDGHRGRVVQHVVSSSEVVPALRRQEPP